MPDLILHNAKIYTVDQRRPWAEAIAIEGNVILRVGSDEEILALATRQTELIDLQRRLVLPGLCDAHIHFYDWSTARRQVPLGGCSSKAEMLERIRQGALETASDAWVCGRGWIETAWDDPSPPTRDELDQITGPDQPAIFWRGDMHTAVVNGEALKRAEIDEHTPDPDGGIIARDAVGQPNGLLYEMAVNLVMDRMPEPDLATLDDVLIEGMKALHRMGITALHDQRMKGQKEGPRALAAYQRLKRSGQLKLRINCNIATHDLAHLAALKLSSGFGDDYVRLGHVKLFADGTLGSQTAWMLKPYPKPDSNAPDNFGINVTPLAQMARAFQQAAALGFPISIHAIGDRANREVLNAFETLTESGLPPSIPHRIEHVQIIDPSDLPRLAALNLTASVQPIAVTDDMEMADRVLGSRATHGYNYRSLADSGALVALGSDAPASHHNPFLGFHAALNRQQVNKMPSPPWHERECLTLEQTIRGYTLGAAQAAGWENVIGSLISGKRADLIVLDRDLFELVDQEPRGHEIADTKVLMTLFDGKIVFECEG